MEKEVRRGDQRVLLLLLLARNLLSRIAGAPAQQSIVLLSEGAGVCSNSSSSSSYFKWLLNLSSLTSLVGSALAFFPYFMDPILFDSAFLSIPLLIYHRFSEGRAGQQQQQCHFPPPPE